MTDEQILEFVKFNLGLTSDTRDAYLQQIIDLTRGELKRSGIDKEGQDEAYCASYDIYLADYCAWLYRTRGGDEPLPQWLWHKRRNLIVGHKDV